VCIGDCRLPRPAVLEIGETYRVDRRERGRDWRPDGWAGMEAAPRQDGRVDTGVCSVQAYSRRATMEMELWRDWSLGVRRSVSGGWWWLAERETVRP
jgi:hypothetical protein